ncbi:MAG: helix-turn-helix domain-containing protein [bacterium]|nr:helix-turn-helix domain-containing protein [bacterium]
MKRKDLSKDIAARLRKIRHAFRYSSPEMARRLNVSGSTYHRNEKGDTIPDTFSLYFLSKSLDVSLDWLITETGTMLRSQKKAGIPGGSGQSSSGDLDDLITHMEHIPRLRFEILAQFHKFKEEHPDTIQREMPDNQ